jgi:hypothetical protein
MPIKEVTITGPNNVKAKVTGQEELLTKVNSIDPAVELNVNVHDAAGNDITSTTVGADTGLDVNIIGGVSLSVDLDAADDTVQVFGSDLTAPIATDTAGHLQVDILTIPEVEIKNDAGNPIPVSGTVTVNQPVAVTDNGGSLTVDGTVNVGNFPATQNVAVTSIVEVEVKNDSGNPLPVSDGGNSITVDGGTGLLRTTGILRPTSSGNVNTAAATFYSVSVANVGAANGSILGVAGNIKPGEVLNFSADAINNYFNSFAYDATGTEFIIIYVS